MKKVLMVCLGNICRSPTAEAILRKKAEELKLQIHVDSAGTAGYHIGEKSDPRSIRHAEARGYQMTHLGRQLHPHDFEIFDLILTMDHSNFLNAKKVICKEEHHSKLIKITDFSTNKALKEIPDPYYGGPKDFELVIDLLEECIDQLILHLSKK